MKNQNQNVLEAGVSKGGYNKKELQAEILRLRYSLDRYACKNDLMYDITWDHRQALIEEYEKRYKKKPKLK